MNIGDIVYVQGNSLDKFYYIGTYGNNTSKAGVVQVHEYGLAYAISNYGIAGVSVLNVMTERQHKLQNLPRIIEEKKNKLVTAQQEIDKLTQELVSYAEQSEE